MCFTAELKLPIETTKESIMFVAKTLANILGAKKEPVVCCEADSTVEVVTPTNTFHIYSPNTYNAQQPGHWKVRAKKDTDLESVTEVLKERILDQEV